jgi:hypothetical protein
MMRTNVISLDGLIHQPFNWMKNTSSTYRTAYLTKKESLKPCLHPRKKTLKKKEKMF